MAAESRGSSQDGRCGGGGDPRWLPSHVAGFKLAAVVVVGIQDGLRVTWVDLRWPLWWWGDPRWPPSHVGRAKMAAVVVVGI